MHVHCHWYFLKILWFIGIVFHTSIQNIVQTPTFAWVFAYVLNPLRMFLFVSLFYNLSSNDTSFRFLLRVCGKEGGLFTPLCPLFHSFTITGSLVLDKQKF